LNSTAAVMLLIFHIIVAVKVRLNSRSGSNLVWMTSQITSDYHEIKEIPYFVIYFVQSCILQGLSFFSALTVLLQLHNF